ncbi:protein GVQW3-like [Gigantopelta aegis]|uniref:protein GVQW3-like n=1 Tax=Gigantopelta aegis TaxID=1735272 RepID=UPI001B8873B7|nr:protein GVQW3-like [Gigantopelta aegis]
MDNISHGTVIRYLGLKGLTPKEIHEDMVVTLGEDAPSYSMVKKWAAEFKRGRESLEDDPRPGRPVTVTTQETIAKIHDIIMAYRRVTGRYIATELGISQERIHAVIHNELQMSKVLARWVPKLLGPDLKRTGLNMSRENLAIFEADPNSFLRRFVTI